MEDQVLRKMQRESAKRQTGIGQTGTGTVPGGKGEQGDRSMLSFEGAPFCQFAAIRWIMRCMNGL